MGQITRSDYWIVIQRPDGGWNTRQSSPDSHSVAGSYAQEYPDCQVFLVEAPTRSAAVASVRRTAPMKLVARARKQEGE